MIKRQDIVEEARTWLGTPYHHGGRVKGVGVDCAGLVICVGVKLFPQVGFRELPPESRSKDVNMNEHFGRWLLPVSMDDVRPGDALTFWIRRPTDRYPLHCGLVSDVGLIHTYTSVGKVVEHRLDEGWLKRRWQAFRFPGVED